MVRRSWMLELPSVFFSIRTERRQASDRCYVLTTLRAPVEPIKERNGGTDARLLACDQILVPHVMAR